MTTLSIPRSVADMLADGETMVCVYCDQAVTDLYCADCMEYKGIMSVADWEAYTGEVWE